MPRTMWEQIKGAAGFVLGRRQRRKLKQDVANMPTQWLVRKYRNGRTVEYEPVGITGKFLICHAYMIGPDKPTTIRSNLAVHRNEFIDDQNRKLFDDYLAAFAGRDVLQWESDGKKVKKGDSAADEVYRPRSV